VNLLIPYSLVLDMYYGALRGNFLIMAAPRSLGVLTRAVNFSSGTSPSYLEARFPRQPQSEESAVPLDKFLNS
jgi:hypothetical protein